jgi:Ni,Fe-hydrogenase I large subunit
VAIVAIEGELTLRLDWDGRRVRRVTVRSTRPFGAARVLERRTPADAAATAPLLFSICGRAQGAAAHAALDAATGAVAAPDDAARREGAVRLETVQEYLWRLLIDWPKAMGREPVVAPVAAARQRIAALSAGTPAADAQAAVAEALAGLAAEHVYGRPPAAWLALPDASAFDAWAREGRTLPAQLLAALDGVPRGLGRSDVPRMPEPDRAALLSTVVPALRGEPAFGRAPDWAGTPVETGALARTRGQPLVAALLQRDGNAVRTRMAARLVELAQLVEGLGPLRREAPVRPWVESLPLSPGEGLGAVETARGLLLHRARVADGIVAAYQIVAPTEWNFHARGAAVRGLDGVEVPDEDALVQCARLVVQALDPCVACNVEVGHA